MSCPYLKTLCLRGCSWLDSESLNYFSHHQSRHADVDSVESVLRSMARGLRTDLRAKTKAKYSGKDQLYDSMRGKSRKMKRCNTNQQRFKNLTHLDLHGCRKLGDQNLENLLQYFHQLEIIRLGRIPAISDRTMTAVAQHCRHLRHLDISHCCLVSSSGLFTVIKHCTKLETLELDKTFQLSENLVNCVRQRNIMISYVQEMDSFRYITSPVPSPVAMASIPPVDGVILGML